jgi:DNA (cytosine-5)-methyltransferase 1
MQPLSQLDLCSGVGAGFPLAGAITGGFRLIGLADIDSYCSDILSKRFPGIYNYGDVRSLADRARCFLGYYFRRQGGIGVISASPPCQPFSVEGLRLGGEDPRDCIPAVITAIAIFQPKFFTLENVPGLLSCPTRPGEPAGSYFRNLLRSIDGIGYDAEWICVPSGYFGTPWIGERLLLVATSRGIVQQFRVMPTSWNEQVRGQVQAVGATPENASSQPRIFRGGFRLTDRLDKPIGTKSGNRIVRQRRQALGNCLDPRLAAIALQRVLYLNSLARNM